MPDLLIWGAGGHAAVVAEIARQTGWTVAAFVDDTPNGKAKGVWDGAAVVGKAEAEAMARGGVRSAAVAVGHPAFRMALASVLEGWGCDLPPLVHPRAVVSGSARLGAGAVVCAGAVVQPLSAVGRLAVVNTLASADHDCDLGEAAHLCPGVRLAGHVRVGVGGWVGVGACARDRVVLGDWCYVGAGAAVVTDLPPGCLAVGVPARVRGPSPYGPLNQPGEASG